MDCRPIQTTVRDAVYSRSRRQRSPKAGLLISLLTVAAAFTLWSSTASAQVPVPLCTTSPQSVVLNFFLHDDLAVRPTGSSFIVVPGVTSPNGVSNTNLFGSIAVFDDSITSGPEVTSTEVARGRGFYVFDYLQIGNTSIEFAWTAIFNVQSGFSGSTLTFRGYDNIGDVYRELAITGGTGSFRLARGWASIYTYYVNGGAAILNITCYVYYGCI